MPEMEIHYADDCAALYVDGKLAMCGKTYNVEEYAFDQLGVKQVVDDAFMLGQNFRSDVAQTLAEIEIYTVSREDRKREAARLREEAASLITRAEQMEKP